MVGGDERGEGNGGDRVAETTHPVPARAYTRTAFTLVHITPSHLVIRDVSSLLLVLMQVYWAQFWLYRWIGCRRRRWRKRSV